MKVTHASGHRWYKEVAEEPLDLFGKSEQKKLKETLRKIESSDVRYRIEPLGNHFFDWWIPMYQDRIRTRNNPKVFNVREKTLGNTNKNKKYFSLTLFEGENRLGGVVFSFNKDTLSFAYRTCRFDWEKARLRSSPSLYVEYVMAEYAKQNGLKHILHGRDHNPYGLNSGIGLAMFKLSTGCRPQLPKSYELEIIETDDVATDVLIFGCPEKLSMNADITKAYLITSQKDVERWQSLFKYPNRLEVEIICREDSGNNTTLGKGHD